MHIAFLSLAITALGASLLATAAVAQDPGNLNPQPLPPLAHPDDPKTPAKELFGRKVAPTAAQATCSDSMRVVVLPVPSRFPSTARPGR